MIDIKVFNEINDITETNVRNIVVLAMSKVAPKFFTAPASSTGKYHPDYAVSEGGLVKHTKAVVYFTKQLLEAYNVNDDYSKSLCIGAALLHDTCKSGINWEYPFTKHEHPILVKELLTDEDVLSIPNGENIWNDMNDIISSHMGKWNTSTRSKVVLPLPETQLQKLLHAADYLASRKEISRIDGVTGENTVNTERPICWASIKQKNLISLLINKADKMKKNTSKYSFVDLEAITAGQASILIKELKDLAEETA